MAIYSMRLDVERRQKAERLAIARGVTISVLVREWIDQAPEPAPERQP